MSTDSDLGAKSNTENTDAMLKLKVNLAKILEKLSGKNDAVKF